MLIALYAFCVVLPAVGFAMGPDAISVHCLSVTAQPADVTADAGRDHHGHDHHVIVADIVHANDDHAGMSHAGMSHIGMSPADMHHTGDAGHSNGKASIPACCGVMCTSALPASLFELAPRTMHRLSAFAGSDAGISGEAPDRLYRPPIALLSL